MLGLVRLVLGIHVSIPDAHKGVDVRDKPGHDVKARRSFRKSGLLHLLVGIDAPELVLRDPAVETIADLIGDDRVASYASLGPLPASSFALSAQRPRT
jgi:hypothetical protein